MAWGRTIAMMQVHYIYSEFYFFYYYISSSSDPETLDPTDSGPQVYRYISPLYRQSLLDLLVCVNFHSMCMFGGDLVAKSCPGLATPWTVALPGSSVHGILQARILGWIVISFSRGIFPTQESNPGLPRCKPILY